MCIKVSDLSHFLSLSLPLLQTDQSSIIMEFPVKRPRSQDEEELKTPTKKRRVPFVKAVEKDFQILIEHLARKREEERRKETNEYGEQCEHEAIETEEAVVCQRCGLVLDNLYGPDVHWFDHAVMPRVYSARDQLNAVDKALYKFIDRICLQTDIPMYTVQERLRAMKIDAGYKSLNYAIALSCILEGDHEAQEKIRPFLPKSNNAWARSMRLMSPPPVIFLKNWLNNLMRTSLTYVPPSSSRDLSKQQEERFRENVQRFDELERKVMHDLAATYDCELDADDFLRLPTQLKIALYKYSMAVRFK